MNPFRLFKRKSERLARKPKVHATVVTQDRKRAPRIDDELHRQLASETYGTPEDRMRRAGG